MRKKFAWPKKLNHEDNMSYGTLLFIDFRGFKYFLSYIYSIKNELASDFEPFD